MEILQVSSKCVESLHITSVFTYFKPSEMSICHYFLFLSSQSSKKPIRNNSINHKKLAGWLVHLFVFNNPHWSYGDAIPFHMRKPGKEAKPRTLSRIVPHSRAKGLSEPCSTEWLFLWHTLQVAAVYTEKLLYFIKHTSVLNNQRWTLIFAILISEVIYAFGIQSIT